MDETTPVKSKVRNTSYSTTSPIVDKTVKLSKRRWLLLGIFMMQECILCFQYSQLSIINNVVVFYYNTSATLVEWTSLVFPLSNILFALPSVRLLNKIGAKYMAILAGAIGCAGAWIKLLSVVPDRFLLLMIGQVLESVSFAMCYGMISLIPAMWFGSKEISFVGTLPIISTQIGSALGFLIPPRMVPDVVDLNLIGQGMRRMHSTVAVASSLVLIMIILFFKSRPKNPASIAQVLQNTVQFGSIFNMWKVMTKTGFILVAPIFASCMSIFGMMITVLNELLLTNFPGSSTDAGVIGFLSTLCGTLSSMLTGYILDRTGLFKRTAIVQVTAACISTLLFTISLKSQNITFVYVSTVLLGTCILACLCTMVQICIEVTYPTPENISVTSMFLFGDVANLILTSTYAFAMKQFGDLIPNIGLVLLLLMCVVLAHSIPLQFERRNTENTGKLSNLTVSRDSESRLLYLQ